MLLLTASENWEMFIFPPPMTKRRTRPEAPISARPIMTVPAEESEDESKGLVSNEDGEWDYMRDISHHMSENDNILDEFSPTPEFAVQRGSQKISSAVTF